MRGRRYLLLVVGALSFACGMIEAPVEPVVAPPTEVEASVPSPMAPEEDSGEHGDDDQVYVETCPSSDPVEQRYLHWAPPRAPQPGSCSEAELGDLTAYLEAVPTPLSLDSVLGRLANASPSCRACLVTNAADAQWAPIPVDNDGHVLTFNTGACYSLTSGDENCGHAAEDVFGCERVACPMCGDPKILAACSSKSLKSACKPYLGLFETACAAAPASTMNSCGTLLDSIRVQCVGP